MGIASAVGTGVAVVTSSIIARQGVPLWDRDIFIAINGLPDHVAPIVWAPMQAGALATPLALGGLVAWRGRRRDGLEIAAAGLATWCAAKALKRVVGRGRPGDHVGATALRLGSADRGLGYPSGHAAVATCLAVTLPRTRRGLVPTALLVLAVGVGLSRIYVGAHYPLDVVGGWALGALSADVAHCVARTLASNEGT